ncbi:HEPN domain-containing protein [Desulfurispora thermophila]|uniref:HEPN domain-containing protein n=1 Tax=Desulfurispora thermophila TaxID=265470 RepID=UPI0003A429CC|nr:HEPN domain-containing protein [Desulfurispora thermophila]
MIWMLQNIVFEEKSCFGLMCQQAVEKALKAVFFEKNGQTPPRKHDLISLAGDAGLLPDLDHEAKKFLRKLTYYYIETRYPDKRVELEQDAQISW